MFNINDDINIHFPLKLKPRKQQIEALDFVRDSINDSKKFMLLNMPTGTGKAQPLYSNVLTPVGWKKMGDLKLGDEIITPNGDISNIICLHPIQNLKIYEFTLSDGRKVESTENHLWKVFSPDWRRTSKWKIKDTKTILKKFSNYKGNGKIPRLYLPFINKIQTKDIELPIDPYLIGCLIGDGGLTQQVSFTNMDEHIIENLNNILIKENLYLSKQKSKYSFLIRNVKNQNSNHLKNKLKDLNLHGLKSIYKFIPDIYKKSSFQQKIELINGLLDTDGSVDKSGSVYYYTSSYKLAKDFQEIVWSIGGYCKLKSRNTKYKDTLKENYILSIKYKDMSIFFKTPIKKSKLPKKTHYDNLKIRITNILEKNETETRCISISDKDSLYITDNYVVTHNSYHSIMFINWYKNYVNENAKFDILTNSKVLQDQYIKDYDFMKNFKGKSNYKCEPFDTNCEQGKELCTIMKKRCEKCPYDVAKNEWKNSEVSLSNFHLFNTIALYLPAFLKERSSNVLIIDEAHDYENVFCDFISTKLNTRGLKKMGFTLKELEDYDKKIKRVTRLEQYVSLINVILIPDLESKDDKYSKEVALHKTSTSRKKEITKYLSQIQINKLKYINFVEEYNKNKDNWVLDINKNTKDKMYSGIELTSQPIWGHNYLAEAIWDKYDHVIFMSGTILDKKMFSYINGLDEKITTYHEMNSPFSVNRRPIYYIQSGKMTYNDKKETFKKQQIWIKKILSKNQNKKGIIHTTTYEFADWVKSNIYDKRLIFHETIDREEKLKKHINSDNDTVIVSPSMSSGIDLKDDLSRFQIILKIPFPNISSNKIKQRQKTNKDWYNWKTCTDFIQSYGRSIRSEDDFAETYVLDSSLSTLLKYNGHLIPRYITDAIKILK